MIIISIPPRLGIVPKISTPPRKLAGGEEWTILVNVQSNPT